MCLSVRKNIFLGTIYNRCFKFCHTVCLGMPYSRDLFLYQLHFNFLLIDDFVYFESKLVRKLASCFLSFHPCCQWMIHEFKYGMSQIISLQSQLPLGEYKMGEKRFACEEERKYHSAKITLYTVSTVNIKSVKDINHDCFS